MKKTKLERASLCVECGPNVRVDEDGCCAACGASAMGPWADKAVAALKARAPSAVQRAERAVVRAAMAEPSASWSQTLEQACDRLERERAKAKKARRP
jgi:hypothetical protein